MVEDNLFDTIGQNGETPKTMSIAYIFEKETKEVKINCHCIIGYH